MYISLMEGTRNEESTGLRQVQAFRHTSQANGSIEELCHGDSAVT